MDGFNLSIVARGEQAITTANKTLSSPDDSLASILFVSAADWAFCTHRLSLAKWLIGQGFNVGVVCPPGEMIGEIKKPD